MNTDKLLKEIDIAIAYRPIITLTDDENFALVVNARSIIIVYRKLIKELRDELKISAMALHAVARHEQPFSHCKNRECLKAKIIMRYRRGK